jgi:hypothetical protein
MDFFDRLIQDLPGLPEAGPILPVTHDDDSFVQPHHSSNEMPSMPRPAKRRAIEPIQQQPTQQQPTQEQQTSPTPQDLATLADSLTKLEALKAKFPGLAQVLHGCVSNAAAIPANDDNKTAVTDCSRHSSSSSNSTGGGSHAERHAERLHVAKQLHDAKFPHSNVCDGKTDEGK